MKFQPMASDEVSRLKQALEANRARNLPLMQDRRTTSFVGTSEELPDSEVIEAIQSVPCHY